MKKLTEAKKQKLLWEELSNLMQGNDYNGGLEFAFNNGFKLHALSCWQNSGASQYNFSVRINRKKEMKEIKALCNYADIFICEHCNHHSFFSPGEIEEDETECESCYKTMKIHSRGK